MVGSKIRPRIWFIWLYFMLWHWFRLFCCHVTSTFMHVIAWMPARHFYIISHECLTLHVTTTPFTYLLGCFLTTLDLHVQVQERAGRRWIDAGRVQERGARKWNRRRKYQRTSRSSSSYCWPSSSSSARAGTTQLVGHSFSIQLDCSPLASSRDHLLYFVSIHVPSDVTIL
jgi:hypothetical protein